MYEECERWPHFYCGVQPLVHSHLENVDVGIGMNQGNKYLLYKPKLVLVLFYKYFVFLLMVFTVPNSENVVQSTLETNGYCLVI